MANETQAQTLDETLNKTDLGHVINENKKPIMIAGVILILAIIAVSIYKNQSNQKANELLNEAYKFQSSVITPFVEGDVQSDATVKSLLNIKSEILGNPNLVPAVLEAAAKLESEGKTAEATQVLQMWLNEFNAGSQLYLFIATKLAPMYEDAGNADKAIEVYESLVAANYEVLQGKMYLELGRLYLAKGNNEKATTFLSHVVENHESTEYAKYARLYLQQIKK